MTTGRESGEREAKVVLHSSYEKHGIPWDLPQCRIFQGQMEIPHPQLSGENIPVRIGLVMISPRRLKSQAEAGQDGNMKSGIELTLTICFPNQKDYFGFAANHHSYGNFSFHLDFLDACYNSFTSGSFMVLAGDGSCLKYFETNQKHQNCSVATYMTEEFFSDIGERELSHFPEKCIKTKSLSGGQFHYIEVLVRVRPAPSQASDESQVCMVGHENIQILMAKNSKQMCSIKTNGTKANVLCK